MKIENTVRKLPANPGIYEFKNKKGETIYVGKAKDLKKRVQAYFRKNYEHSSRTKKLMEQAESLNYTVTNSELEALILETTLIQKLRPKYNILMKDDKSYSYLKININEDFPTISIIRDREKKEEKARYFGPTSSTHKLQKTYRLLKKLFPFKHCKLKISKDGKVTNKVIEYPCLDYHIKRCPGPCIGKVSVEEYKDTILRIIGFLEGNSKEVEKSLKTQMTELAMNKKFEQAALVRDKLASIKELMSKQAIADPDGGEFDILNFYYQEGRYFFHMFMIRGGKLVESEDFVMTGESEAPEALEAFLTQYYKSASEIPWEILIPEKFENLELVEKWLKEERKGEVKLRVPHMGRSKRLLNLCGKNAQVHAKQSRASWMVEKSGVLEELAKILGVKKLGRIEAYDISHLGGKDAAGSMVVFERGIPKKSHYRLFNLRLAKNDDYLSMKEILMRRFKKLNLPQKKYRFRKALKKEEKFIRETLKKNKLDSKKFVLKEFFVVDRLLGFARIKVHKTKPKPITELASLWISPKFAKEKLDHTLIREIIEKTKSKRIYTKTETDLVSYFEEIGFEQIKTVPAVLKSKTKTCLVYDKTKHTEDPSFSSIPDLILIDGGKGQLGVGVEVMKYFNLKIPVAALAKRLEEIYVPGKTSPIVLEEGSETLKLLQQLRDEAHRFAVTQQRKLHRKTLLT